MDRVFLGWDRPALAVAAEFILPAKSPSTLADLSDVLIVVPGGRVARRMLELLLQRSGGRLQPPQIVTVSALPELLYEPQWPFADELTQKLAWIEALRGLTSEDASRIVRDLPTEEDFSGWLSLAEVLLYHHRELAGFNLSFQDAARVGGNVQGAGEQARWLALSRVQERYLAVLDRLRLWDKQTARLEAIKRHECQTDQTIYLVGTSDLDTIFCRMLDQVCEQVRVLVAAPEERASRFDEYGRVVPGEWQDAVIDLDEEQVAVVDGPEDQAEQVARALAELGSRYRADEITIGVPDEGLVPRVRRLLQECSIPTRWFAAQLLGDSAPCRLLAALAQLLDEGTMAAFTALVRHPDVSAWLSQQGVPGPWLSQLDGYIQTTVPAAFPPQRFPDGRAGKNVKRVVERIQQLSEPLSGLPRRLPEWGAVILDILMEIYAGVDLDSSLPGHAAVLSAAERIQQAVARHDDLPPELMPSVSAETAIRLVLKEMGSETLPAASDPEAVELLGWLELPLDDAPALVVTTLNEGFVPESVNADPFLPDQLRTRLGIVDNRRRYARDAYALSLLLHSRKTLRLIAGRRDRRGDPLIPSRLLLAGDHETVARRILRFYQSDRTEFLAPLLGPLSATRDRHGFTIPRPPERVDPPASIRVTALRDFLESPYRYFLQHVAGLEELDDRADEMGAQSFGILAHDVLARFGGSEMKDSTDPSAIMEFLNSVLDEDAAQRFGQARCVAVEVQVEQLRARFDHFAEWQAGHVADGWSIVHVEKDCQIDQFDAGGGKSVCLKARIDRIDQHRPSGQWAIYDYKTGEGAKSPDKTHRARGEWTDLQLPLYRLLARSLGVTGEVQIGYLQISPEASTVEDSAGWSDADQAEAEERARKAVRDILEGDFWKPLEGAARPRWPGAVDAICQGGVFDREAVV